MPPASLSAPAARIVSGRWSTSHPAPFKPPASSSAVAANSTSRRRPGTTSTAGSRPALAGARREQPEHADLERHHRLHVDRPAPPDVAVGDLRGERRMRPALGRRRDDVEVRQEQQRVPAGAVAAEPRDHAAAAGRGLQDLGREAGRAQLVGDSVGRVELRPRRVGRVDRRDPDQGLQAGDELVVGPIPRAQRRCRPTAGVTADRRSPRSAGRRAAGSRGWPRRCPARTRSRRSR